MPARGPRRPHTCWRTRYRRRPPAPRWRAGWRRRAVPRDRTCRCARSPRRLPALRWARRVQRYGYDVHLRLAGEPGAAELVDRGIVELAEAFAERNLLLVRHLLVAEQQDQVLVPGTSDGFQRALVETSDVNAPHLGAKRGAGRHDLDPWLGPRPNALHAGKVRFRVLLVKRPAWRRARNGRWNRAQDRASCAPSAPRRRCGRSADRS